MEGYQRKDFSKQVSDSHIKEMSWTHCRKWRHLPPHLGIENTVKDDIDRRFVDEREKKYDFFIEWKERKGADATYEALINGLLKIGCESDAEYLCQLIQPEPSATQEASVTPLSSTSATASEPSNTASITTAAAATMSSPSSVTTQTTFSPSNTTPTQATFGPVQPSSTVPNELSDSTGL